MFLYSKEIQGVPNKPPSPQVKKQGRGNLCRSLRKYLASALETLS